MSLSVIKLHFFDDNGKEYYRRFAVTNGITTVAAAIRSGLDRLQLHHLPCQISMLGQQHGSNKQFPVQEEDLIRLDHDYAFVDRKCIVSLANNTNMAATRRSPFVRIPALSSTLTTPTSHVFDEHAQSTPASSHSASVSACKPAAPLIRRPKLFELSKTEKLKNFYIDNMMEVDAFHVRKKEVAGRMFHEIDVINQFGLLPQRKAAFFILCQQTNPQLNEAAVYVITEACFEILRCLWPKLDVPPAEKQMLADLVSAVTCYSDLKNISLANRSGTLDYRIKHFRRQHPEVMSDAKSPSAKRLKLAASAAHVNDQIQLLSVKMNPENDSRILHELYESSALQRASWEKQLHGEPDLASGIMAKLVSKFPHITSDISLIHYDFNILVSARRRNIKSLSETFRCLVPAIYQVAYNLGIPEAEVPYDSTDEREYMAASLLVEVLKRKCPRSALDYSRLVIHESDSLDHRAAMAKRKAEGITAPMIVIMGCAPAVSFYIAAGDMVFKVRGRFAEALQSYMEVIFVSNDKYDKKTTGISYFFEYLINIKEHQNTSRMTVAKELEAARAAITQHADSVTDQFPRDENLGSIDNGL